MTTKVSILVTAAWLLLLGCVTYDLSEPLFPLKATLSRNTETASSSFRLPTVELDTGQRHLRRRPNWPPPPATSAGHVAMWAASIDVTTKPSPLDEYDETMLKRIMAVWLAKSRRATIQGSVGVIFELEPTGIVRNLRIEHNTADYGVYDLCLKSIREAGPFDPFPDTVFGSYRNRRREVYLTFRY